MEILGESKRKSVLASCTPAMAVGLAARLAVIPFLYHEWMAPFVVEHWAFGRVARSLITGHGFGNVFADTGATSVLPPVYAYLLAAVFRVLGDHTASSVIAALAINSRFSVLACVPVFLLARQVSGERVAKWTCWGW